MRHILSSSRLFAVAAKYVSLLCFMLPAFSWSQEVYKYWVTFTDKDSSVYSLDRPAEFLSERALQRRAKQRIMVDSLDLPVSGRHLQAVVDAGYGVQHRSRWFNAAVVYSATDSLGARLAELPCVQSVEPLGAYSLTQPQLPTSPIDKTLHIRFIGELYSPNYYRNGYDQIEQLSGVALHRKGYQGQGILIGVCDGGFPGVDSVDSFDSLRRSGRLVATRDFVWEGDNVFSLNGHGTLVLSNLAANIPGFYVGTAPMASYVLCRTEDTYHEGLFEEYNWIAAAEYLDSLGVDLITSSLGYFYFDDSTTSHTLSTLNGRTAPMTRAAEIAFSRGILVVNSAGNDGNKDPQHLNVPADAEHVLTVGAATREGVPAEFSSYGPTVDLRVKPDVMALGQAVACVNQYGTISIANGTSMAGPIMAGMMACLMQRYPHLIPQQLCDSVRSWGSTSQFPDRCGGYGIPDFSRALPHDPTAGIHSPSHPQHVTLSVTEMRRLVIRFEEALTSPSEIVLIDIQGRECLRQPLRPHLATQRIDISALPVGFYVARIGSSSYKLRVE